MRGREELPKLDVGGSNPLARCSHDVTGPAAMLSRAGDRADFKREGRLQLMK